MLNTVYDPSFQREAQEAILEHVKEINEIDYVEHGSDNIVVIVNKELVFRFPRTQDKARRIAYETAILQKTKGKITAVAVPELVKSAACATKPASKAWMSLGQNTLFVSLNRAGYLTTNCALSLTNTTISGKITQLTSRTFLLSMTTCI